MREDESRHHRSDEITGFVDALVSRRLALVPQLDPSPATMARQRHQWLAHGWPTFQIARQSCPHRKNDQLGRWRRSPLRHLVRDGRPTSAPRLRCHQVVTLSKGELINEEKTTAFQASSYHIDPFSDIHCLRAKFDDFSSVFVRRPPFQQCLLVSSEIQRFSAGLLQFNIRFELVERSEVQPEKL